MPQFAVETFSSQIFWVLMGFFAIYVFMSFYTEPNLQKTLDERENCVNSLVNEAGEIGEHARSIEKGAEEALKKAEMDFAVTESKLLASFKEQSSKEKEALFEVFSQESRKKSADLALSSEECFQLLQNSSEEMVRVATQKISGKS